jgi:hypothetical protein
MDLRLGVALLVLLATGCGVANPRLAGSSPASSVRGLPSTSASSARLVSPSPSVDCAAPMGCPAQWFPAGLAFDIDRQTLVLFGGARIAGPVGNINDTWEWTAAGGWVLRHPATIPAARLQTAMVYDRSRHRVVMYGGRGTVGGTLQCGGEVGSEICSADTWTWNGTDWTQLQPQNSPDPFVPRMAYDQTSDAMLLYSSAAETWSWDGNTWALKAPVAGSPTPLHAAPVVAFDPATRHVVLFGGFNDGGADVHSMWSWSGQGWSSLGVDAPLAGLESAAVENVDGATMLGYQYANGLNPGPAQTWVWNGTHWRRLNPSHEPTASALGIFADPKSHQVLLVGDDFEKGNAIEIWSWDGADWSQLV